MAAVATQQQTIPPPPKPPSAPNDHDESMHEKAIRMSDFYTSLYQDDVPKLSSKELLSMMSTKNDSVVLVDVRTDDEIQVSTLPGAVTMQEFEATGPNSEETRPVVVYCTVGYRSGFHARRFLTGSICGGRKVYNLDGIIAYTHENGPLVVPKTGGTSTNRVHTYSAKWACLHADYQAVYYSKSAVIITWMSSTTKRILLKPHPLSYGIAWAVALLCFGMGQRRSGALFVVSITIFRLYKLSWRTTPKEKVI